MVKSNKAENPLPGNGINREQLGIKLEQTMPLDPENKPSGKRRRIKPSAPRRVGRTDFTVEDHLLVQKSIEGRAFAVWEKRGRPTGDDWKDWLQAEDEAVMEFCRSYLSRQNASTSPGGRAKRAFSGHQASRIVK